MPSEKISATISRSACYKIAIGPQVPPSEGKNAQPCRILIVDDSAGDVRLLKEAFGEIETPHSLYVANDGLDALDFVYGRHNHPDKPAPDIMLLDVNLPKISGHDVLRKVKADPILRHIVVLMFSSSSEEGDVVAAYDAQANGYLKKPCALDGFFEIAKAIEKFWLLVAKMPTFGGN